MPSSMNYKTLFRNFLYAGLAQGMGLILGLFTSLVIPKFLSIEDFGYWQLFLFYSSYVGFFHFGLNDGVYLIKGGQSRSIINRSEIASQFLFCLILQFAISLFIVIVIFLSSLESERQFVLFATALFLVVCNASSFLGYLFQAMNETKTFSISILVNQLIFFFFLVIMLAFNIIDYHLYVLAYLLAKLCSLLYCIGKSFDILKSNILPFSNILKTSFLSIRVGMKLMIANIASTLIFGIVRFLVDFTWGIESFGQLSLSISLMTFILTFLSQIGMVLFPALRQADKQETKRFINVLRDISYLLFPIVYIFYVPIAWIIEIWLPQYQTAIFWFALLLPACIYDGKMNICYSTYYKVSRNEDLLLRINIVTVILSTIGAVASILVFDSPEFAILSAVIAITIRSYASDSIISKKLDLTNRFRFGDLIITLIFLLTVLNSSDLIVEIACTIAYLIFVFKNKRLTKSLIGLKKTG